MGTSHSNLDQLRRACGSAGELTCLERIIPWIMVAMASCMLVVPTVCGFQGLWTRPTMPGDWVITAWFWLVVGLPAVLFTAFAWFAVRRDTWRWWHYGVTALATCHTLYLLVHLVMYQHKWEFGT